MNVVHRRCAIWHAIILLVQLTSSLGGVHGRPNRLGWRQLSDNSPAPGLPPLSACDESSNDVPFTSLQDIAQSATAAIQSGVPFYRNSQPSLCSCIFSLPILRTLASPTLPGVKPLSALCSATLLADAALLNGAEAGAGGSDTGLSRPGGGGVGGESALMEAQTRVWLLRWGLDGLAAATDVNVAAQYMVSGPHIAEVLNTASMVQVSSGRRAFWVLYGAIQQVTAVTANATLWGGQDGVAVTQLLGNALLVLPDARPEDRIDIMRAALAAAPAASGQLPPTTPQQGATPIPPPCSPPAECPNSMNQFLVQVVWAATGGLALTLALATLTFIVLKVGRRRRRSQGVGSIGADGVWMERGGESGPGSLYLSESFQDDISSEGSIRTKNLFLGPNHVCATVTLPDGKLQLAVASRVRVTSTGNKKEDEDTSRMGSAKFPEESGGDSLGESVGST